MQVNEFIIWMAENLRYADSTATPALVGNTACIGERGERCEEGNLYTYAAAVNDLECATKVCFESEKQVRGICPEGWRLPKKADWNWLTGIETIRVDFKDKTTFYLWIYLRGKFGGIRAVSSSLTILITC